ncbi:MAG: hypothetical protein WBB19_16000 [Desulforhopalus sp.]
MAKRNAGRAAHDASRKTAECVARNTMVPASSRGQITTSNKTNGGNVSFIVDKTPVPR